MKNNFIKIAGPCSAETRDQVLSTAQQLYNQGNVDIFRAGIWKPRTRPGAFEGVGVHGLEWLNEVQKKYKFKTAIEVATITQTELAINYGVDILWLGARTVTSPFAVQEIAEVLTGVDIPVYVKNPMNADIGLWVGAVERLLNAGITNIVLIHRGFSSVTKSKYRNMPMWNIAIEMMQKFPDIPMIVDPSHISGQTSNIGEITQRALNFGYKGWMTEVHEDPTKAWSDAAQQLTPFEYDAYVDSLKFKNPLSEGFSELDDLRATIDELDALLLSTLNNRMNISRKIGQFKDDKNTHALQLNRWKEVIEDKLSHAQKLNLSEHFVKNIFNEIHSMSLEVQDEIIQKKFN